MIVLTGRDKAIFGDLVAHRVVSAAWLARAHFGGSQPACWERLRKLTGAGYVEKVATAPGAPKAYRVTNKGKAALGLATVGRPATAVRPAQLFHTMAIADVAALLLGYAAGAGHRAAWLCERELRAGAAAAWLPAGVVPDGVLTLTARADGAVHRLAVEVELTSKALHRYGKKLAWYRRCLDAGALQGVRWYVPDAGVGTALRKALAAAGTPTSDQRVEVLALPRAARYGC